MKIYADTSVFGGVYDREFAAASRKFFDEVAAGRYDLVVSATVQYEISHAPEQIRRFYQGVVGRAEVFRLTPAAVALRDAYLDAGVLTQKSIEDAAHVALATVLGCQVIVSWNFKHIVNFQKIPKYNAVNELNGYTRLDILSPMEVLNYGDA